MSLYTIFFKVNYNDKNIAKIFNLRFDVKTKMWFLKTKNIENNEVINHLSRLFKIVFITFKNSICDEDLTKSFNSNFITDKDERNKYFLNFIGLGPDEDEETIEPIISEIKI